MMAPAERIRALVVDKNYHSGLVVARRLERSGYDVEQVGSAADVISHLGEDKLPPDLIVVEILSSGMDLFELPRMIERETQWGRRIPCIAHTVLSDSTSLERAVRGGYVDYLVRPVELERFLERVRNVTVDGPRLNPASFVAPIAESGRISFDIRILKISESGMVCQSDIDLPRNSMVHVDAPSLRGIGIPSQAVRVARVERIEHPEARFQYLLTFVGLNAHQLRRVYARCLELGKMSHQ